MHFLITCINSPTLHGLDGFVIRGACEQACYREMAEYADLLAEQWDILIVTICSVGGPYDPHEDGQLLSTTTYTGPDRAEVMRESLLFRNAWTKRVQVPKIIVGSWERAT